MALKTPSFWYKTGPFVNKLKSAACLPLSAAYLAGHGINCLVHRPYKARIPVICVGNLVAGGSGKTPVSLALAACLKEMKIKEFCFLSRGYGGRLKGPVLVTPTSHNSKDVGDEPLLLARCAPVIVSKNRRAGIRYAEKNGFKAVIMDDGLQNPTIAKTLSFIVINGPRGLGNGLVLPAGPLREPLQTGMSRADAVIVIGPDHHNIAAKLKPKTPLFTAGLAVPKEFEVDKTTSYIGFTGLGDPGKFRRTLEKDLGITLCGWQTYPDHYHYTDQDLTRLQKQARENEARMITTEKDAVRLPQAFKDSAELDIVPVRINWNQKQEIATLLESVIKQPAAPAPEGGETTETI